MTRPFELTISAQHWLGPGDPCSHGRIRAVIAGTVVTDMDNDDYGINQSALLLLRTLDEDHQLGGDYLLCHGCGYPVHFGCPDFGTDWAVRHHGDTVVLLQPTHYAALHVGRRDRLSETEYDVRALVPAADYRREIVAFARQARDFYFAEGPRQLAEWEREFHDAFWAEFAQRLERARPQRVDLEGELRS
jgi:hypothetical protein